MRHLGREEGGFTLVELLVSIVMLGILFGAFSLLIGATVRHSSDVQEQNLLQTEARAASERLVADLRQAYTGDENVALVESMSASSIVFLSPDRGTPLRLRKISYRVSGNELQRSTISSTNTSAPPWTWPSGATTWSKAVGSVRNPSSIFTYFDAYGATTTDRTLVRTVGVNLVLATGITPKRQFTYATSVTLRAGW